ncbi:hypothetical protein AYK25_04920 [Thermoplasmatales archaeon SM1-50]|nr:MAG: hypothetical protein AYK25_04920 [Thermoplasmatales archaeon SM1-50]
MEITACPNCGSKNIGIGTLGDGIISGLSSWKEVCRDCGYQGASLVFESEAVYQKFLDALHHQKRQQQQQTKQTIEQTPDQELDEQPTKQKERETTLHMRDIDPGNQENKRYHFEFILAIVIAIVFFIILFGSSYLRIDNDLSSQNDFVTLLFTLLGSFIGVVIFFFLVIVLLEMAYRSIYRQKK